MIEPVPAGECGKHPDAHQLDWLMDDSITEEVNLLMYGQSYMRQVRMPRGFHSSFGTEHTRSSVVARDADITFSIRAQIFDAFVAEAARMEKIKNAVGVGASEFVQTRPSSVGWPIKHVPAADHIQLELTNGVRVEVRHSERRTALVCRVPLLAHLPS